MRTIDTSTSRTGMALGLLLALCLALALTSVKAEGKGEAQVRAAIETWVRYVTADARPDAMVERMEPFQLDGETVAYIAHLAGGGFALCGADDLVLPVYFYSPQGTYDPQNPDYQYILREIGTRLKYLRRGLEERDPKLQPYQEALSKRAAFWQELTAGRAPTRMEEPEGTLAEPISMTLNLTSQWHQGPPYNALTPMGDGGRTLVGCVATAAAQIMRYWNWPPSGTGSHSYTWLGDVSCGGLVGGGTLSATFSDAYDWQNMPDDCTWGCSPEQEAALSELSYEVGVAVEMIYGVCGSLAIEPGVETALEDYFRYDLDATWGLGNANMMTQEIQWLRPLTLAGENWDVAGHAWVVFGYNKGTDPIQFRMNMGWGGSDDGWYSLDAVPEGFNLVQNHVTHIAPEAVVRFVGSEASGDGSPNEPYWGIEQAVTEAPDETILIFKAGSINTFSASTLIIDRPLTLKGWDVVIHQE